MDFNTKMEYVKNKFFFHEKIKKTADSCHYIVEDEQPNYPVHSVEDTILYLK